jgi:hypothetical protein
MGMEWKSIAIIMLIMIMTMMTTMDRMVTLIASLLAIRRRHNAHVLSGPTRHAPSFTTITIITTTTTITRMVMTMAIGEHRSAVLVLEEARACMAKTTTTMRATGTAEGHLLKFVVDGHRGSYTTTTKIMTTMAHHHHHRPPHKSVCYSIHRLYLPSYIHLHSHPHILTRNLQSSIFFSSFPLIPFFSLSHFNCALLLSVLLWFTATYYFTSCLSTTSTTTLLLRTHIHPSSLFCTSLPPPFIFPLFSFFFDAC